MVRACRRVVQVSRGAQGRGKPARGTPPSAVFSRLTCAERVDSGTMTRSYKEALVPQSALDVVLSWPPLKPPKFLDVDGLGALVATSGDTLDSAFIKTCLGGAKSGALGPHGTALRAALTEDSRTAFVRALLGQWKAAKYSGRYPWVLDVFAALAGPANFSTFETLLGTWAKTAGATRKRAISATTVFRTHGGPGAVMALLRLIDSGRAHHTLRGPLEEAAEAIAADRSVSLDGLYAEFLPLEATLLALDKPKSVPKLVDKKALPDLVYRDASRGAVPPKITQAVVRAVTHMASHAPSRLVRQLQHAFTAQSLADLAAQLMTDWKAADYHGRARWVMYACGHLGDDRVAVPLGDAVMQWAMGSDTDRKRAIEAMGAFANIGTHAALMLLYGLAMVQNRPSVYDAAVSQLDAVASARGTTADDLGDSIVPDCGLDAQGSRVFHVGETAFKLVLDENFDARLRAVETPRGPVFHTLDAAAAHIGASVDAASAAAWTMLQAKIAHVVRIQTRRLEHAMVTERTWSGAAWHAHIRAHPLMINFAQRLVWAARDPEGGPEVWSTFRAAEDGTLVNVEDDEVSLADGAEVRLVHPCMLGDALPAWAESFADYELFPPFDQLGRPVFVPTAQEHADGKVTTRFTGTTFDPVAMRGWLTRLMWKRDGYGPIRDSFYRGFQGERGTVRIHIEPGIHAGHAAYSDPQTVTKITFPASLAKQQVAFSETLLALDYAANHAFEAE